MGYWKSKVLPKIQKVFGKDVAKKAAAAEACKSFDESKEAITKEFEEKKGELQPKVIEIYEASSTEIKTLVKEPKAAGIGKHSVKVQEFLDELVKIEFPGSKAVSDATTKCTPALVSGPVIFIFEKVSTFVVTEEKPREVEVEAPAPEAAASEAAAAPAEATSTTTETTDVAEKEIVVEEEKPKEAEAEKPTEPEPPKAGEEPPKA